MKRFILVLTFIAIGSLLCVAQTSLADAARQAKTDKKATPAAKHVYTNDDVSEASAPAVEKASAAEGSTDSAKTDAKAEGTKADGTKTDAKADDKKDSKEDKTAKANALKDKIASQKKAIADQEREINVMEREHQIRVAEYYADAGNSLRTGEKWFQDEKAYQESLESKKKALSDAKSALDEMSEQARKAGVPVS